jgi:hypothetical protein
VGYPLDAPSALGVLDIIAMPANPMEDIESLRKINLMRKEGNPVRRPGTQVFPFHSRGSFDGALTRWRSRGLAQDDTGFGGKKGTKKGDSLNCVIYFNRAPAGWHPVNGAGTPRV